MAPFKDAEQTDNYTLTLDLYSLSNGTHPGYSPKFEITDKLVEGKWYLFNECMYFRKYGPQESITYNITFPAVFGDELKHSVVTYWGDDPYLSSGRILHSIKPECTRALFDGQEITVKKVSRATLSREVFFYFIES